jgi:hypothetical protein
MNPCKPYASTRHNFAVFIFNCDFSLFTAQWLTGTGPAGGKIYGHVKVPQGTYLAVGVATCKNVVTNFSFVNACCGKEVCVNLIPRRFQQCVYELNTAIRQALANLTGYSFSSPAQPIDKGLKEALHQAEDALNNLSKHLPKYELAIPLDRLQEAQSNEQLKKLVKSRK